MNEPSSCGGVPWPPLALLARPASPGSPAPARAPTAPARSPRPGRWLLSLLGGLGLLLGAGEARAEGLVSRAEAGPEWLASQLLPSPYLAHSPSATGLALGWQVTPLLWALRMPPAAPKLRAFVVDPLARVSGSIGLVVQPLWLPSGDRHALGLALGGQVTWPLLQKGEALAVWAGVSALSIDGQTTPLYEAGLSTLFGVFGLTAARAPGLAGGTTLLGLRVRYF